MNMLMYMDNWWRLQLTQGTLNKTLRQVEHLNPVPGQNGLKFSLWDIRK